MGKFMTKLRGSLLICATICTVIVLALMIGAIAYGANSQISHGPVGPPLPDDSPVFSAHGPVGPPLPDDSPVFSAHGPVGPPLPDDSPVFSA
jgi:hypothetical protein